MHDASGMRGLDRARDLQDHVRDIVEGQGRVPFGVAFEQLAAGPFDGEEVQPGARLADLDRAHYIRVGDACAVLRLADEAGNRGLVIAQLLAKHFDGAHAVLRMFRPEDG